MRISNIPGSNVPTSKIPTSKIPTSKISTSKISTSKIPQNDVSSDASYGAPMYDALTLERCYHPAATSKGFDGIHASPLTGLPYRDLIVLQGWFDREDIDEITANIGDRLSQLCPEPCWDEHSYDFLGDLLKRAASSKALLESRIK